MNGNGDLVSAVLANPATADISPKLKSLLNIAATFCMFNRYVDGLATWAPDDPAIYDAIVKQRASEGYLTKPFQVAQP